MDRRLSQPFIVVVATGAVLATAACGGGTSNGAQDPTVSITSAGTTSDASTAPSGGLEPRPGLPALVDGEAAACLPLCASGRVADREIPAGTYQTRWFFGGAMTVEFDTPWSLWEDSTGEFSVGQVDDPDYRVALWLDIYPVVAGERVEGVPNTADGLVGWLRSNSSLVVSEPIESSIGAMPATAVDISISSTAVNDDPTCPAPVCQNFFGFEQWGDSFGIAGADPYRMWFADVSYSGTDHVLVAAMESHDPDHFARFLPVAEALMATIEVPARPG